MIALPSSPGPYGTALIVAGLVLGSVLGWVVWGRLRRRLGAGGATTAAVAGVLAAALASSVGLAPYLAWRVVQDLRYTSKIQRPIVERIAAYENNLDGAAFDEVAQIIPRHATFYVKASDPTRMNFELWALSALLPRIALSDPGQAQWILTLGIDPRTLGVALATVRRIPTSYGDAAPVYLARVAG